MSDIQRGDEREATRDRDPVSQRQRKRPSSFAPATGSGTVVRCSCGVEVAYEDRPTGGTRKPAKVLIRLFRHFHEPHGTVTVESPNNDYTTGVR